MGCLTLKTVSTSPQPNTSLPSLVHCVDNEIINL